MPKGLDYIINLKDGDFGGAAHAKSEMHGIDTAVENTHGHLGSLKEMVGEVGVMFVEAFAVEKVIDFGKESLGVYQATASAQAQITAGIKSTAGAAGVGLAELTEQAEQLAHKTLFSPAQTEQAQAIALSFTNIKGIILHDTIPAIQDMATRMGMDLNSASLMVSKALQDPIKGVGTLQKQGVRLSETQKEMVESMVDVGNTAGAQKLILHELSTEFGGSAAAARKAKGAMGDWAEKTEEMKVSFGEFINNGLNAAIPVLLSVGHWFADNKSVIADVATVVGAGAGAWLLYQAALLGVSAVTAVTTGIMAAYNGLAAITLYYDVARAEGMGVLTAAQWALNVAMEANPIGLIITGIGLLVGGLYIAYQKSETFRAVLAGIGEAAMELWPIFKGLGEVIWGALTFDPSLIKKGFDDSVKGVQAVITNGGLSGAFNKGYDKSIDESHKAEAERAKGEKKGTASDLVTHGTEKPKTAAKKGAGGDGSTTLAGGHSVRNVTVTIGKLIERLEVHTTNLQGVSTSDIKRQLTELLTGVVHDSELALGSQ